ncbi:MAG: hypothetical protein ACI9MC_000233 [Kiritimatiellia bacterium]
MALAGSMEAALSDELEDMDSEEVPRGPGAMAYMLPLATAAVALAIGGGVGALAVGLAWRSNPPEIELVQRELTAAELEAACNPFVTDTLTVLTLAQAKVVDLEDQVVIKAARVAELEETMSQRADAGKAIMQELREARVELETLRTQLQQAVQEKEAAIEELKVTVEKLEKTEEELVETKERLVISEEDALSNRWTAFTRDAQLQICDKGRRKRLGKCREAVFIAMGDAVEAKYRHCVKSGQAVPGFQETTREEAELPDYSFYLNEEDRITKGWYVTLCDPTLPEAVDFASALKSVQEGENAGGADELQGVLDDFDDLDIDD